MSSSSDQIFNICLPKVGAESFFIFTLVFVSKDSKDRILKQLSEVKVVQKHLKIQSSAVYLSILFVPSFTLMGVSKSSFFFFFQQNLIMTITSTSENYIMSLKLSLKENTEVGSKIQKEKD